MYPCRQRHLFWNTLKNNMTKHELKVQKRNLQGRKVKQLRQSGVIPGHVFGKNIASLSIQTDVKEFVTTFKEAGESSLVYLHVDSDRDARPVFISQVSKHPLTGDFLHVSFHQVDLKEKVTAPVPILLQGESPAEKEKLGIMVQQLDEIEIEALPTDMPENIHIDVTGLAQVGEHIAVKDLKLDLSKLEVKTDPETILVQIEALAKEEVAPVVEVAPESETSTVETPVSGAAPSDKNDTKPQAT